MASKTSVCVSVVSALSSRGSKLWYPAVYVARQCENGGGLIWSYVGPCGWFYSAEFMAWSCARSEADELGCEFLPGIRIGIAVAPAGEEAKS